MPRTPTDFPGSGPAEFQHEASHLGGRGGCALIFEVAAQSHLSFSEVEAAAVERAAVQCTRLGLQAVVADAPRKLDLAQMALRVLDSSLEVVVLPLEIEALRKWEHWPRFIDMCALCGLRILVGDSLCDPRSSEDRLRLEGTERRKYDVAWIDLASFDEGQRREVLSWCRRQSLLQTAPIAGFDPTPSGGWSITTDEDSRRAFSRVFEDFALYGSGLQLYLAYRRRKQLLPVRRRGDGTEVQWSVPSYRHVLSLINEAAYSGALVARIPSGGTHDVEEIFLVNHHDGYLKWENYLENKLTLAANRGRAASSRLPKNDQQRPLLVGLLRCKRCGRKLNAGYSSAASRAPHYHCRGSRVVDGGDWCLFIGGRKVEKAVLAGVKERLESLESEEGAGWNDSGRSFVPSEIKEVENEVEVIGKMVSEIIVESDDVRREIVLLIRWSGGGATRLRVRRNRKAERRDMSTTEVVDLVREMAVDRDDRAMAAALNRRGARDHRGRPWTVSTVQVVREKHEIALGGPSADARMTMTAAAKELGISTTLMKKFLEKGIVQGRQISPMTPWLIPKASLQDPSVAIAIRDARMRRSRRRDT